MTTPQETPKDMNDNHTPESEGQTFEIVKNQWLANNRYPLRVHHDDYFEICQEFVKRRQKIEAQQPGKLHIFTPEEIEAHRIKAYKPIHLNNIVKSLQECKDEVAVMHDYENWHDLKRDCQKNDDDDAYEKYYNLATVLYCKQLTSIIAERDQAVKELKAVIDSYATNARVIHLYLKSFCNEELNFADMIGEAARQAAIFIEQQKAVIEERDRQLKHSVDHLEGLLDEANATIEQQKKVITDWENRYRDLDAKYCNLYNSIDHDQDTRL